MKKRICLFLSILLIIIYFYPITVKADYNTYTITISCESNNSHYSVEYTGNPTVSSNGNVITYTWKTPATITISASDGYYIYPPSSSEADYIKEDIANNKNVNYCSASYDRNLNAPYNSGITGNFSTGLKQYKITISNDAFNISDGTTSGYSPDCLNPSNINISFTVISGTYSDYTAGFSPTNSNNSNNTPTTNTPNTQNSEGSKIVAQYEADDTSNSNWNKVIIKIKDFQDIIRLITNFLFGFSILNGILCLIISVIKYSSSSTHPMLRRQSIIDLGASAICIALLGSVKLLASLIIQISL